MQWNDYVYNEVVPFIRNSTSWETPIITSGASFGALHSANLFFKRPDLINGCIAMSGVYDLTEYTKGFYNDGSIAIRILSFENKPIDHVFFRNRLENAIQLRKNPNFGTKIRTLILFLIKN